MESLWVFFRQQSAVTLWNFDVVTQSDLDVLAATNGSHALQILALRWVVFATAIPIGLFSFLRIRDREKKAKSPS